MYKSITFDSTVRYHQTAWKVIQDYIQLTKPRVIILLLITTATGMMVAAKGHIDSLLLVITLVSRICAAGAANIMNCIYDRDIEFLMERTRHCPLSSGRIKLHHAL